MAVVFRLNRMPSRCQRLEVRFDQCVRGEGRLDIINLFCQATIQTHTAEDGDLHKKVRYVPMTVWSERAVIG